MKYTKDKKTGEIVLVSDEGTPLVCPFQSQHLGQNNFGQLTSIQQNCSSKCALFRCVPSDIELPTSLHIEQRCRDWSYSGIVAAEFVPDPGAKIIGVPN